MTSKHGLGLLGRGRNPVLVHSTPVPVLREVVHGLGVGHETSLRSAALEMLIQLRFRPEAVDVASGEGHVVPEAAGRNEQMDEAVGPDLSGFDPPLETRIVTVSDAIAEQGQESQGIPGTIRIPPARAHFGAIRRLDTGEWVRHGNPIGSGHERQPVLRLEPIESV